MATSPNRYYAEQDGNRWLIRDRHQSGKVVGQVYSRAEPKATLCALNEDGYIDAD